MCEKCLVSDWTTNLCMSANNLVSQSLSVNPLKNRSVMHLAMENLRKVNKSIKAIGAEGNSCVTSVQRISLPQEKEMWSY